MLLGLFFLTPQKEPFKIFNCLLFLGLVVFRFLQGIEFGPFTGDGSLFVVLSLRKSKIVEFCSGLEAPLKKTVTKRLQNEPLHNTGNILNCTFLTVDIKTTAFQRFNRHLGKFHGRSARWENPLKQPEWLDSSWKRERVGFGHSIFGVLC